MRIADQLISRLGERTATVGVLGMGYAGLPLACRFAEAGFRTIGLDIDGFKIHELACGRSYIGHIAGEHIAGLVRSGRFFPSGEMGRIADCDLAIICVPTPLGEGSSPNLEYVTATARTVREHVHQGMLIVLESTTYPGTTEEVVLPLFSDCRLRLGEDLFMAYSPEREDPGNPGFCTKTIPKIVGGITPTCLQDACKAYGFVVDRVVPVSSARVAESAKLLETAFDVEPNGKANLGSLSHPAKNEMWQLKWTTEGIGLHTSHYLAFTPTVSFEEYKQWLKITDLLPV